MAQAATFRFYGDLNDFLPRDQRRRELRYAFFGTPAVKDAIEAIGVPHTEVALLLINGDAAGFGYRISGGERITVYPPFETLVLSPVLSVAPDPPPLRFVLDGHLGRLAAKMRMLGFDVLWTQNPADEELARISSEEGRVLLTRDVGLLKRSNVTWGYFVRATSPTEQVVEVGRRFALDAHATPFTRCLRCNGQLRSASREEVAPELPPAVLERHDEFRRCEHCHRIYWRGSHFERMEHGLRELLDSLS